MYPTDLKQAYKEKRISKSELIHSLKNEALYGDSVIQSLEILADLQDDRLYEFIEEFAISNDMKVIRMKALKLLISYYPHKCVDLVKYSIKNINRFDEMIELYKTPDLNEYRLPEKYSELLAKLKDKFETHTHKDIDSLLGIALKYKRFKYAR